MVCFILSDLCIFSKDLQDVMPPRLDPPMEEWLQASGITGWSLHWSKRPVPPSDGVSKYWSNITWDTAIEFERDKDAMLFKLRWL